MNTSKELREKSQDFAVRYHEALAEDDYKLAEKLTVDHLALIQSQVREARKLELEKTHKAIDDTYMILTNDIDSLLTQDEVYRIRKQHKDELHKNIDNRIKALKDSTEDKQL